MKKLVTILAIVLFSLSSFSQDLTDQFYFRFGYSNPSWSQYGLSENDWDDGTSKVGATFELGSIFMLKSILKADNMSFGINADYLYAIYGNFSQKENNFENNLGTLRIGSKLGPSFTISPMDKMAIDIYTKVDFAWATAAVHYGNKIGDADDYFSGYADFGFSTGLNFRYGLLILGFEFNTISTELESDDYPGFYLQDLFNNEAGTDSETKSKLPCMNFTIGMSF